MLSQEEYAAFERAQSNKAFSNETFPEEFINYERWQVTRYTTNPKQYFITARAELGTHFKHYANLGLWKGGREIENRMFEELQYNYRSLEGVKVIKSQVTWNCKLFEVSQYGKPILMVMILNGDRIYSSKPFTIKGAYRYRLKAQ